MLGFFKSLFRPQTSSETAKERLRLVLLSDHLSLAPDVVEALKADLLAVIRKYVVIDEQHADVSFEHRDREVSMLASVPILSMKDRERAKERAAMIASNEPAPAESSAAASVTVSAEETETVAEEGDETEEIEEEGASVAGEAQAGATFSSMSGGARRKRRRRKRPAEHPLPA